MKKLPEDSLKTRGMKCWAMVASLSLAHTLFSDSTACKNRKKNNKEGKEISLIAEGRRSEVTKG